jgi:hypothetical protein
MKLTPEEILEINRYLFNALKQKDFDVKLSTKSGYIRNVSKFGVNSLPGICHSYFDGKQEYSYLCLEAGRVDPSDLGFYCSKEEDCVLNKYSQSKQVKIDIRTYKRIIDAFVLSMESTHDKYVKGKMMTEGRLPRVKIKLTGDAFEGKDGVLEEEKGDTLTVLVNFDDKGRKVRQYFKKENIDYIESENLLERKNKPFKFLKEDDNEEDAVLAPMEVTDKRQVSLATFLGVDIEDVVPYNSYYSNRGDYQNVYVIMDSDLSEYIVLTASEAYQRAYENAKDYYENDAESISDYHIDNFVDLEYMDRYWEEYERDSLSYLSEPELYEEAVNYNVLSDSDFKLDERGNPIFDEPISELDADDILEKIMEKKMDQHSDGVEWFREIFGEKEFREFVVEHGLIDISQVAEDAVDNDFGEWIASYDNDEIDLNLSEDGENVYAYRVA